MKETIINGIGCMMGQDKINPDLKTIIFVHAAGSSHRGWTPQVEYLSRKYNTVAINLPGHGLGRKQGEATIDGYVKAVRVLIEGLSIQKAALAGISMGGAITQQFALSYPEKLIGIILIGSGARMKVMPEIFNLIDRVAEIKLPCLIFSGADDKLAFPKFQDYLHEKIAGSRLIRFENAGHALNMEKPDEVNKAIEEFLDGLPE
jgi:pimeloyl-ACP methyl ester carboxylesterase